MSGEQATPAQELEHVRSPALATLLALCVREFSPDEMRELATMLYAESVRRGA